MRPQIFPIFVTTLAFTSSAFAEYLAPDEAVAIALEKNFSLSLARDQTAAAANNRAAGLGPFLPGVSASATHSGRLDSASQPQTTVGASLNWLIFDGFQNYHAYRRLRSEEKAAALQERLALETTLESVVSAYYEVVRQTRRLAAIGELLAVSQERAKRAQAKAELGAGTRMEQLQSLADLNADSSSLLAQRAAVHDAKVRLNQFLARNPALDFEVADSIPLQEALPLDAWRAGLRDNNTSILLAAAARDAASSGLSQARGGWWPDLNAGLSYSAAPDALNPGPAPGRDGFGYNVSLSVPIFDHFQTRKATGNARLDLRQGETRLRQREEDIGAEFEQEREQYRSGMKRVALEERNLEVARLQAEAAQERFRAGATSPLEFRDAQSKLLDAQSRLVSARQDTKQAELALKRLSGRLVVGKGGP